MKLRKAAEDYLEAMLMMQEQHGYIRSIDVARHLGVTKPSVSYATKHLKENGYIVMADDNLITLTDAGMEIAQRVYTRHKTLMVCLLHLGVDEQSAMEDACKIEHDISEKTFEALQRHAQRYGGDNAGKKQAET